MYVNVQMCYLNILYVQMLCLLFKSDNCLWICQCFIDLSCLKPCTVDDNAECKCTCTVSKRTIILYFFAPVFKLQFLSLNFHCHKAFLKDQSIGKAWVFLLLLAVCASFVTLTLLWRWKKNIQLALLKFALSRSQCDICIFLPWRGLSTRQTAEKCTAGKMGRLHLTHREVIFSL